MKLARIASAALISAAFTAGCTEQPTTSVQRPPASRPVFEGGGYMGNGGIVPPADTTKNDPTATTSSTPTTPDAAPGGGYAGNGG